jgi:UDP-N-acetylmuramyl pentapeptide synthase
VRKTIGTLLGKSVAGAVRLRGKSGAQAMPGLVVETLIPGYLGAMLSQLAGGVIVVTGTNGKTTTTKMIVELLEANRMKVLTNPTGSNLTRGIISSVSQQASKEGSLPYDIAVFELDEAYARQFTDVIKPRFVVGLNASRDQLDRFGEVDKVVELVSETMLSAVQGIIVNADDQRLSAAIRASSIPVTYFGVAPKLLTFFPRDEEIVSIKQTSHLARATNEKPAVELTSFKDDQATYRLNGVSYKVTLQVTGQHNFQNAAAALALVRTLLPDVDANILVTQLSEVKPAFGRGQIYKLKNG